MSRPYLKYRFKELEDILKNKQEDENVDDIINELSFRKSPKAKALYDKIKHRKKDQSHQTDNKANHYSQKQNKSNEKEPEQSFEEDENIFINFSNALDIEIGEVKKEVGNKQLI